MISRILLFTAVSITLSLCGQERTGGNLRSVGGPCEGCEAALEYQGKLSNSVQTISFQKASRPVKISGTVFKSDRMTPAADVVLYFYHTDKSGNYAASSDAEGWGRRHGKNRAWLKTDKNGQYEFYCDRPASYPDRSEPEHIHITVFENGMTPYYIDSIVFDDDELLTQKHRSEASNRGGSGIVTLTAGINQAEGKRDIILGLNIPEYF